MTSTSISAEFQAEFARLKSAVEASLPTPALAAQSLLTLRQALISHHGQIPAYDQKKYEREIRDLEARMDASRASRPKAKFAFKRTPTSRPSTPATPGTPTTPSETSAGPSAAAGAGAGGEGGKAGEKKEGKDEGYTISGITGRTVTAADIVPRLSGTEKDITLTLSSLDRCLVDLRSCPLRNLHLDRLSSCLLLLPPSPVGVLAHRLSASVLSVPNCAQFRLHDSHDIVLVLGIQSYPVIEGCRAIFTMPSLELGAGEGGKEAGKEAGAGGQGGESEEEGRWNKVQDFDSPTGDSTNWGALTSEEQEKVKSALRRSIETNDVEAALAAIP